MDLAMEAPTADDTRQAAGDRRHSQDASRPIDGLPVRKSAKMERVNSWIAECAKSRATMTAKKSHARRQQQSRCQQQQQHRGDVSLADSDCDWETEELLLRVLVARPRFQKIPTAEEVRLFARQLRVYHSRLWTLDQTRGYFRARTEQSREDGLTYTSPPPYPEDIDDVDDMRRWEEPVEEEEEGIPEDDDSVATPKAPIRVRKISPVEEELRDEMIRGYWMLRRKKANMRLRTESITQDFCQSPEPLPYRPRNAAC